MTDIVIQTTLNLVPVNGLAIEPQITIVRVSDNTTVVSAQDMTDVGAGGFYKYSYVGEPGEEYAFTVDTDPSATDQTDQRTYAGAFDNQLEDIWNDRGLNPSNPKNITENTAGSDYTEEVPDVGDIVDLEKSVVKTGSVTTITRNP